MQVNLVIAYVKRLAKKLKKEKGITHTEALNEVSQQYGYRDYQHLINTAKNENKIP